MNHSLTARTRLSVRHRNALAARLTADGHTGATELCDGLARFLVLTSHCRTTVVPTEPVDAAWHAFLTMGAYRSESRRLAGAVIVHDTRRRSRHRREQLARRTVKAASRAFGRGHGLGTVSELLEAKCCGGHKPR